MKFLWLSSCLYLAAVFASGPAEAFPISPRPGLQQVTARRHPAAALLLQDGRHLAIANRCSGSLILLDSDSGAVQSETPLGGALSAIAIWPDSDRLAITDYARHELILATVRDGTLRVTQRLPVARYPVAVAISRAGTSVAVASLWSRRLTVFDFSDSQATGKPDAPQAPQQVTLNLPFAPHAVLFTDTGTLITSEAFGGRIGIHTTGTRTVQTCQFHVHNIRDLEVHDGRLWFSHQLLRDTARTEEEHIHWGILLENFVSSIPLQRLLQRTHQRQLRLDRVRIGDAGNGAGDPAGVALLRDRIAVTLSGTDQLALIDRVGVREIRLPTGSRPLDVVCDERRQRAFVLNSLADSVTLVDLQEPAVLRTVSLGPRPEPGPVERGEAAFFNARLSLENWMSCHSCHTDGHTSHRRADTQGDGGFGNPKQIPSVLGTAGTGPWGWTGQRKTLEHQLRKSLATTMHTAGIPDGLVADLSAYLNSQSAPPSLAAARQQPGSRNSPDSLPSTQQTGAMLFRRSGCLDCHAGPQLTARSVFDVGLKDETGNRKFNPPSLVGVSQRDRLLHDGRAASLEALLQIHPPDLQLSDQERRLLTAYLAGL